MNKHLTITMLVFTLGLILGGCSDDTVEPVIMEDTSISSMLTPPTLAEIQNAVSLNASQLSVIGHELALWKSENENQDGSSRMMESEQYFEMATGRQPGLMINFVARVAPSLETPELDSLVEFLVNHRRAGMNNHREGSNGQGGYQGRRPGGHPDESHGGPFAELGLTSNQVQALRNLRVEQLNGFHSLLEQFANDTITEEEFFEQAQALRQSNLALLSEILTEDQLATLEEMREERQTARINRKLENLTNGMDQRLDRLTLILELSDDQQNQIQSILETSLPGQEAILNGILNGEVDFEDGREQLTEIAQTNQIAVRALLTEAQLERLAAIHPLFPRMR